MNRIGPYLAIALVLVTNAFVLIGVERNRMGGGREIELTSRELPLGYAPREQENTGTSLRLQFERRWVPDTYGNSAPEWIDAAKLKDLGFDTRVDPNGPAAEQFHGHTLPRLVYVALEFDGPLRRAWIAGRPDKGSRLFPFDAARDAYTLRRKYPDARAVLITRCRVALRFIAGKRLEGTIYQPIPDDIHVPLPYSATLESFRGKHSTACTQNEPPCYAVRLMYGANYEPWVTGVRLLQE